MMEVVLDLRLGREGLDSSITHVWMALWLQKQEAERGYRTALGPGVLLMALAL